jgi:hypothetical protein
LGCASAVGDRRLPLDDIEGSARLTEEQSDEAQAVVADRDVRMRVAIETNSCDVFATGGDGFAAARTRRRGPRQRGFPDVVQRSNTST